MQLHQLFKRNYVTHLSEYLINSIYINYFQMHAYKTTTNNIVSGNSHQPDAMASLAKENKQLKSMLLLHLNLIQEQSDMLVSKDKQIASLQGKLDRLERKQKSQDENDSPAATISSTQTGIITTSSAMTTGTIRPAITQQQQLSRGTIMKMAALNTGSHNTGVGGGKGQQLRIRPLMISLKKVIPAVIEQPQITKQLPTIQQQQQSQKAQSQQDIQNQAWNQFLNSHKIKSEPTESEDAKPSSDIQSMEVVVDNNQRTNNNNNNNTTTISAPTAMTLEIAKVNNSIIDFNAKVNDNEIIIKSDNNNITSVPDDDLNNDSSSSSDSDPDPLIIDPEYPEVIASDGSPTDFPIELKLEDDEEDENMEINLCSPVKQQPPSLTSPQATITSKSESNTSQPPITIKVEPDNIPPVEVKLRPLTRESLSEMRFDMLVNSSKKRSSSECSNRAPRKYSRVMSTKKMYISRQWEEEDAEEPNSLVVAELKEGESNLEVPNWKEIDSIGLDEEVAQEEAPSLIVTSEDLSEAAFLKRHSKHEADERRRKKWDIQRFREQRTIEKLKKRQFKSDIYSTSVSGVQPTQFVEEQANIAFPMSLYPNLTSIRHVETTEYLPVQAFGEPIPTLHNQEFQLPWHVLGRGDSSVSGLVEWPDKDQLQSQQQSQMSSSLGGSMLTFGDSNNSNNHSKYSSFYVRQNSSLMNIRLSSSRDNNSSSSKYRFKRVKSQGSSSGRR